MEMEEDEFKESSESDSEYSDFDYSYINALKYYFNQKHHSSQENIIHPESNYIIILNLIFLKR